MDIKTQNHMQVSEQRAQNLASNGAIDHLPSKQEWGPVFWYVMKTVALGLGPILDENLKNHTRAFFKSLAHLLPCDQCREHYQQLISHTFPLENALTGSDAMFKWVNQLEAHVKATRDSKNQVVKSVPSVITANSISTKSVPSVQTSRTLVKKKPDSSVKHERLTSIPNKRVNLTGLSNAAASNVRSDIMERLERSSRNYKKPCSC